MDMTESLKPTQPLSKPAADQSLNNKKRLLPDDWALFRQIKPATEQALSIRKRKYQEEEDLSLGDAEAADVRPDDWQVAQWDSTGPNVPVVTEAGGTVAQAEAAVALVSLASLRMAL